MSERSHFLCLRAYPNYSVRKIDYEYTRNGSVNVFMAVEPKAGRYLTKVTENRKATEFAHFSMDLGEEYKAEIAIGMYSRQSLGDGRVGDIKYLKAQTSAWTKRTNKKEIKIPWRFTTSKAQTSFGYSLRKSA